MAARRPRKPPARRFPRERIPPWPTFLIPAVSEAFDDLQVSAALWFGGITWQTIRRFPSVMSFESEHGVAQRRWSYNERVFAEVARTRRPVMGTHQGLHDLFVPVQDVSGVRSILVAGPFMSERPTSAEILSRWHALTHSSGRLGDPAFSEYLTLTLATLTLEGSLLSEFESLLGHFARILEGRPDITAAELAVAKSRLAEARFADNCTLHVRGLLDERQAWTYATVDAIDTLASMGLRRPPQNVVVGLLSDRLADQDPVDGWVRCDALQRACAAFAKRRGNAACGTVGNEGVVFVVDAAGAETRVRSELAVLVTRIGSMARRFGLKLSAGTATAATADDLPARFRSALGAAEHALSRGAPVVHAEKPIEGSHVSLRRLRVELAQTPPDRSALLLPRFDRYVEAALAHAGHRVGPVRAQLQAALERLSEPLMATGALDEKGFDELVVAAVRASEEARTVTAAVEPYRRAITDIAGLLRAPTASRHERGTRRAVQFMREHLGEPLSLDRVARASGFSPDYFSRLFRREHGRSFQAYLSALRLARARELLAGSSLSIESIVRLCGLRSRGYFHRAFRRALGITPSEYRKRERRPVLPVVVA